MIKTTIIRDKKGKILEVIEEADFYEYIASDEEEEGDPYL